MSHKIRRTIPTNFIWTLEQTFLDCNSETQTVNFRKSRTEGVERVTKLTYQLCQSKAKVLYEVFLAATIDKSWTTESLPRHRKQKIKWF